MRRVVCKWLNHTVHIRNMILVIRNWYNINTKNLDKYMFDVDNMQKSSRRIDCTDYVYCFLSIDMCSLCILLIFSYIMSPLSSE